MKQNNKILVYVSCLENSMDRRAWQAAVHGVTKGHDWEPKHTQYMCNCVRPTD